MTKNILTATLSAALITGLFAMPALASDDRDDDDRRYVTSDMANWLSMEAIAKKLGAAGYTDIDDIEVEHGLFEVDARDPEGNRVELKINPVTGDVIGLKREGLWK